MHTLRTLRDIALDHAGAAQPDLASMARELGRTIHTDSQALAGQLAPLGTRQRGLGRWQLATRNRPAVSVLVMAWPANYCTPVHDHAGLWGLEMTLLGALEVQSWRRQPDGGELVPCGRDWLGPGDGTWFEGDDRHVHRCRNLSGHDTAFTLHVYGGELRDFFAYEQHGADGAWVAQHQQSALAGHLRG